VPGADACAEVLGQLEDGVGAAPDQGVDGGRVGAGDGRANAPVHVATQQKRCVVAEPGPESIAGVPAERADARSRSTTTPTKPSDADVVEPTTWDPRAPTPTECRRRARRDRVARRRRRSEPVHAEGRPPPGPRGPPLRTTLNAAARRAESTRRRDALRTANGRSAIAAGR